MDLEADLWRDAPEPIVWRDAVWVRAGELDGFTSEDVPLVGYQRRNGDECASLPADDLEQYGQDYYLAARFLSVKRHPAYGDDPERLPELTLSAALAVAVLEGEQDDEPPLEGWPEGEEL
ncbi:hypothetical protein [Candidatus Poriferisodalis sp.]|uniref:hypothetical protein n=1 Tax=Candidatus Poriferisodalis sp. TaxID=3101277 RepID=UPI003B521BE8